MKKYSCFIFDFDGTLADSRMNIANSLNYALHAHNIDIVKNELVFPLIGKLNIQDTFRYFHPQLSSEQINALVEDFRTYQKQHALGEIVLFDTVRSTLQQLHNHNISLAIVTTKHIDQIKHVLRALEVAQYFEVVFGLGLMEYTKPDKQCFAYVQKHLPRPYANTNCVMVGDSSVDCEFARNSNLDMIGVKHGVDSAETLVAHGAITVVDSFDQLLQCAV